VDKFTHTVLSTERLEVRELEKKYEKTEEDLKAVQSVGQIVAEVLKQLDDERCEFKFPLLLTTTPLLTRIPRTRLCYISPVNTETV